MNDTNTSKRVIQYFKKAINVSRGYSWDKESMVLIEKFNPYEVFYDKTKRIMWPFNTGNWSIKVTAWVG